MNIPRICACLLFPFQVAQAVEAPCRPSDSRIACAKEKAAVRKPGVPHGIEQQPSPSAVSVKPEMPTPVAARAIQPTAPLPVPTCDPGGCWDSGGNRYHGGVGNTYLDQNGRPCQRNGGWLQCF